MWMTWKLQVVGNGMTMGSNIEKLRSIERRNPHRHIGSFLVKIIAIERFFYHCMNICASLSYDSAAWSQWPLSTTAHFEKSPHKFSGRET